MNTRIYLRVAKIAGNKTKVVASTKSSEEPIFKVGYRSEKTALPTVGFAVDFEIPDELFTKASTVVAKINIATKEALILGEVPVTKKS